MQNEADQDLGTSSSVWFGVWSERLAAGICNWRAPARHTICAPQLANSFAKVFRRVWYLVDAESYL